MYFNKGFNSTTPPKRKQKKKRGKTKKRRVTSKPIQVAKGKFITQVFVNTNGRTRQRPRGKATLTDMKGDVGVAQNVSNVMGGRAKRDYPPRFGDRYYLSQYKIAQIENKINSFATKGEVKSKRKKQKESMLLLTNSNQQTQEQLQQLQNGTVQLRSDLQNENTQLKRDIFTGVTNLFRQGRVSNTGQTTRSVGGELSVGRVKDDDGTVVEEIGDVPEPANRPPSSMLRPKTAAQASSAVGQLVQDLEASTPAEAPKQEEPPTVDKLMAKLNEMESRARGRPRRTSRAPNKYSDSAEKTRAIELKKSAAAAAKTLRQLTTPAKPTQERKRQLRFQSGAPVKTTPSLGENKDSATASAYEGASPKSRVEHLKYAEGARRASPVKLARQELAKAELTSKAHYTPRPSEGADDESYSSDEFEVESDAE